MPGAVVICQSLRTSLEPMEPLIARHGLTAAYGETLPAEPVCFVVCAGGKGLAAAEEALCAYAERFSVPVYLLGPRPRRLCGWFLYGPDREGAALWDDDDRATVENHLAFLCAAAEVLAEQKLEQILGRAFHSLRTPLVTVDMALSRLAAAHDSDDPALVQSLEVARRNLARMQYLTKRFLRLAGGRAGSTQPPEPVALQEIAKECQRLLSPYVSQKKLQLDLQVGEDCVCLGSPSDVTEIVYNLMENAVKFTPRGGQITVSGRGGKEETTFVVEDAADPIPPAERERVFGRFVRLPAHRSLHPEGAGLGLHIVADLVEGMGGRIRITAGRSGNRFEVTLPAGAAK